MIEKRGSGPVLYDVGPTTKYNCPCLFAAGEWITGKRTLDSVSQTEFTPPSTTIEGSCEREWASYRGQYVRQKCPSAEQPISQGQCSFDSMITCISPTMFAPFSHIYNRISFLIDYGMISELAMTKYRRPTCIGEAN